MKKNLLALIVFFASYAQAQDKQVSNLQSEARKEVKKDPNQKEGWTKGGSLNLALGQGASRNWTAGAEQSSFSANAMLYLFANKKSKKDYWDNALTTSFGFIQATSSGTRKNDDRIDIISKYGTRIFDHAYFTNLANFRTQFTEGFDYSQLVDTARNRYKRTSHLMAPAYAVVASGIEWKPKEYFSVFYSPASIRWIIVIKNPREFAALYNVDPARKVAIEFGSFANINFRKEVLKNINYQSRLDLYSNYLHDPFNVDVYWTNALNMKVNKWISVTYNLDMIYDNDAMFKGGLAGLQLKSFLGVGFAARF
jgi:hypothetical protein